MASGQNYGVNMSSKADQIFTEQSIAKKLFNTAKTEFVSADTVRVFTNSTDPLVAYDETSLSPLTAANGGMVLHKNDYVDYKITRNLGQSRMVQDFLQLANPVAKIAEIQNNVILEQEVPAYDKYVYGKIVAGATNAPLIWTPGSTTAGQGARDLVLKARGILRDARVPMSSLKGVCTEAFLMEALVNLNSNSDTGYLNITKGQLPSIGGIPFTTVSQLDMPGTTKAFIASDQSVFAPIILQTAKVNPNVPGFRGAEILISDISDAFVFKNKANGIVVINTAA